MLNKHNTESGAMRPIEFRWIEVFRAVALSGSTTGAAELLNLDQSAVSRHISALEGQLRVLLVDRNQRKLQLTQEGKILLEEACNTLEGLDLFRRVAPDWGVMFCNSKDRRDNSISVRNVSLYL
jgi:molybdenum-dependent DNA-binding transcriptional regulator ModE